MVICIAGELTKRESAWNNVMGETWIITTGCSPAHTIDSACTIGVVASESVKNFDAAFSANHQNVCTFLVYRQVLSWNFGDNNIFILGAISCDIHRQEKRKI